MRDLWTTSDLPVLTAYAELDAEGEDLLNAEDDVATRVVLTSQEVQRSLAKLSDAGLLPTQATNVGLFVIGVTAAGVREAGGWPSADLGADRLMAALEHLAVHGADEPTRSKGKVALAQLGGLGRDTLAAVAATVITGHLPGQ